MISLLFLCSYRIINVMSEKGMWYRARPRAVVGRAPLLKDSAYNRSKASFVSLLVSKFFNLTRGMAWEDEGIIDQQPPPAAPFKSMRYWPHGGDDHDVFMAGSRGEELEGERSIQSQGRIDRTFIWKSSPKSADIKSNNAMKTYDVLSKVSSKRR